MSKSTVAFEWQELPPNQDFPSHALAAPTPKRQQPRWIVPIGALCLLVLALVGAVWVERQAQAGLAEIQHELALAVDAEVWQTEQARSSVATSIGEGALGDRAALAEYQFARAWPIPQRAAAIVPTDLLQGTAINQEKVQSVEVAALQRDLAAVTVITEAAPEDAHPGQRAAIAYRQVRFYRHTDQGWLPARPQPALWGQSQRLATQHFDFTYRSRDAQTVETVAADLDARYADLRTNMGLPPTPPHKIAIDVVVGEIVGEGSGSSLPSDQRAAHIRVSSPALARAPALRTDAAILRHSILLDLVGKVIEEAASTHRIPSRWNSLLSAMGQWQLWEREEASDAWCARELAWLHANLTTIDMDLFPSTVRSLLTPYHDYAGAPIGYVGSEFQATLSVAVLDYAAATYGRTRIGALWPLLRQHSGWETLIPAAFDVPIAEFDAGWRAYLAQLSATSLD